MIAILNSILRDRHVFGAVYTQTRRRFRYIEEVGRNDEERLGSLLDNPSPVRPQHRLLCLHRDHESCDEIGAPPQILLLQYLDDWLLLHTHRVSATYARPTRLLLMLYTQPVCKPHNVITGAHPTHSRPGRLPRLSTRPRPHDRRTPTRNPGPNPDYLSPAHCFAALGELADRLASSNRKDRAGSTVPPSKTASTGTCHARSTSTQTSSSPRQRSWIFNGGHATLTSLLNTP